MNVNLDALLAIIGGKEVDIFLLRQEIAALKQSLSELEETNCRPAADLKTK